MTILKDKNRTFLQKLDNFPLLWTVIPLLFVGLYYYVFLGDSVVFEINDQLDETLFTYVLNAKYLFSGVKEYPELLGGVPVGGMTVSAPLFVPLYRIFPLLTVFMVQFAVVSILAYAGMYLSVKELTGSSLAGVIAGSMFFFLPFQPVYGLSLMGGPLAFYAFLCLYKKKNKVLSYVFLAIFALGANLVLLGYVILGLFVLACIVMVVRKEKNRWFLFGGIEVLVLYLMVNYNLITELFLGSGGYVSHREEMVIQKTGPFLQSAVAVFLYSSQHAPTEHEKLLIPLLLIWLFGVVLYRSLRKESKTLFWIMTTIFLLNIAIAVFYGLCQSDMVVDFRNRASGFFHYFSAYRVYWLYPTTWYLLVGTALGLVWKEVQAHSEKLLMQLLCMVVCAALFLPTAWQIGQNSIWLLNKSQYKNNCNVGLMSWRDYFAEDVMEEISAYIQDTTGLRQEEYRVASLGMCPAVALEAGFSI